jgi:hypothetical protein
MAEPAAQEAIAQNQPGVAEEHHVGTTVARLDEQEIQPAPFQCVDKARPLAPCQHAIHLHARIHERVDRVGDVVEGRRTQEGSSRHGCRCYLLSCLINDESGSAEQPRACRILSLQE